MPFNYAILKDWFNAEEEKDRPELTGLLPHQKLLLLSDGSMTLDLELLWRSMVEVEVKFQGITRLGDEAALYLEEKKGKDALEREVWLTVDDKKLVYAHSVIPLDRIEDSILNDILANSSEPLGRVLTTRKVFFAKKKLEDGVVSCESAATDLGIDAKTPLIARRYILYNNSTPTKWVIKAGVTEIFSPEIISNRFLKER